MTATVTRDEILQELEALREGAQQLRERLTAVEERVATEGRRREL